MTSTQTSFSAFAATQTDPGNFAVSDQSGQRGCFFPQRKYRLGDSTVSITGSSDCIFYFDFAMFDGPLDAPVWLPSGGHMGVLSGNTVIGLSSVSRR